MELEIGEIIPRNINRNVYLLEIENMHGDADAESYSHLFFKKNMKAI